MNLPAARPWLILALIFILGAITGALLTVAFAPPPGPPGPQQMGNHWMTHLTERLKLTDDQQEKIRPIVMDAEKQIISAHHEDVAKIGSIMQEADAKIAEQLQPDQREALKQLQKDRERMFFRHMHSGRGPGEHHPDDDDHPPGPPAVSPPPSS